MRTRLPRLMVRSFVLCCLLFFFLFCVFSFHSSPLIRLILSHLISLTLDAFDSIYRLSATHDISQNTSIRDIILAIADPQSRANIQTDSSIYPTNKHENNMSIPRNLLPFFLFRAILLLASFSSPTSRHTAPDPKFDVDIYTYTFTQNNHTLQHQEAPHIARSLESDCFPPFDVETLPNPTRSISINISTQARKRIPTSPPTTSPVPVMRHERKANVNATLALPLLSTPETTVETETKHTKHTEAKKPLSTAAIVQVGIGTAAIVTALVF